MNNFLNPLAHCKPWMKAFDIQKNAVIEFYNRCESVLKGSCRLKPLESDLLKMERNLFSTLFLTIINTLPIPEEKIPFYAVAIHCLRTLVTGCDNLLDNEYKEVIPFDLKGGGYKFKSVFMIMTADRVMSEMGLEYYSNGIISYHQASKLSTSVMKILGPSGIEEHEEESGSGIQIPDPQSMLSDYLYRKTGKLFESPINLLVEMDEVSLEQVNHILYILAQFGIGCQLLDEIKDMEEDLTAGGHNMVLSLLFHEHGHFTRNEVCEVVSGIRSDKNLEHAIKKAKKQCFSLAKDHFVRSKKGFSDIVPEFGHAQALALAMFVKKMILKEQDVNEVLIP